MSNKGCDGRVDIGNIQVKCGTKIWIPETPYSVGKQVWCMDCQNQWEQLAEKLELIILEDEEDDDDGLPSWWKEKIKGTPNG